MLYAYLNAELVKARDCREVIQFVEEKMKELIREAVLVWEDHIWSPDEELHFKDGTEVTSVEERDGVVFIYYTDPGGSEGRRVLHESEWYTDDLLQLLEAMQSSDESLEV